MLVLTRSARQSFYIYPEDVPQDMTVAELFAEGPIEVSVAEVRGRQVKIGINAPPELTVLRNELFLQDKAV